MKKRRIVFLLVNSIGYGHFKRSLVVARKLKEQGNEVFFVTQAKNCDIFKNCGFVVYNFPMIYTMENSYIKIFTSIIDQILKKINPDVVIEDTYGEDFYLGLPSIKYVPRVLISRRQATKAVHNNLLNGLYSNYQKVIFVGEEQENNDAEECWLLSKKILKYSDRYKYAKAVYDIPDEKIREQVIRKYKINEYKKVIVTNCGAGGWHLGKNQCIYIFESVLKMSKNLPSDVLSIIVLGPYSSYLKEYLKSDISDNIKIVEYEHKLNGLVAVADVVIIRPGYNITMEALNGKGHIVLIPSESCSEEQYNWSIELKNNYDGVEVVPLNKYDELFKTVTRCLGEEKTFDRTVCDDSRMIADLITDVTKYQYKTQQKLLVAVDETLSRYKEKIVNKDICVMNGNEISSCTEAKNISIPVVDGYNFNLKAHHDAVAFICNENRDYPTKNEMKFKISELKTGLATIEFTEIELSNCSRAEKHLKKVLSPYSNYSKNILFVLNEEGFSEMILNNLNYLLKALKSYKFETTTLFKYIKNVYEEKEKEFYYEPYFLDFKDIN